MWLIRKISVASFILFLLEIELVPCAIAHKVTIFAYVEGGKVYTESYYSDGTRCRQSVIEVFDSSGKKILSGKTDEKGEFSFVPQKASELRLVLSASMGHRNETTLTKKDLLDGGVAPGKKEALNGPEIVGRIDAKALQRMLDQTLDKKLHPLMKLLVENQKKGVSARDVFAGIGYIFGLMGLVIYIRNVKKDNKRGMEQ